MSVSARRARKLRREIAESEKLLDRISESGSPETLVQRAQVMSRIADARMELGQFEQAVQYYTDAEAILWRFANGHVAAIVAGERRGLALIELGRLEDALEAVTQLLDKVGVGATATKHPDLVTGAIDMRLVLLERLGRIEEAGAAADAVIETLEPGSTSHKRAAIAKAFRIRGVAAQERGDHKAALVAYEAAIDRARAGRSYDFRVTEALATTAREALLAELHQ